MNKSTGTYINPLDPIFDRPYHDTNGGSGVLEVTFLCEGEIVSEYEDTRYLPYNYIHTGGGGVDIDMVSPQVTNCMAIEEDIHTSLRRVFGKNYTLSFGK